MKSVILIVEDFEYDALEAAATLRRAKLADHIEVVRSAEDALDYLKQATPPDLIVVDLSLPLMDGIELIHTVRSKPELARIVIVILTGREDDEEVFAAMGADVYLKKPLDVNKLVEKLRPLDSGWANATP